MAGIFHAAPARAEMPELAPQAEPPAEPAVTSSVRPAQPVILRTERARRVTAARARPTTLTTRPLAQPAEEKPSGTTYASAAVPGGIQIRQIAGSKARLGGMEKRIRIAEIVVENAPASIAAALEDLNRAMIAKPVGVSDLFASADYLQKALQARSLSLAVATVPDQLVRDGGPLLLKVTTPAYAGLDLTAVPERLRPLVEARLAAFGTGGGPFDHAAFDSALFLLQEQTGLTFRASNGERGRDSVIAIGATNRWVSGEQTFSTGMGYPAKWLTSLTTLTLHSPLGLGERIYGSGHLGLREEFRLYKGPANWGQLGVNIPVASSGLALDLSLSRYYDRRRIRGPYEDFFGTETTRIQARLEYPVIMSRYNKLMLRLGIDGTRQNQFLIVEPEPQFDLWREETRALRLGADWQMTLDNQMQIEAQGEASQGLKGLGAGSSLGNLPWSQTGAKPAFQKIEARAKLRLPAGNDFMVELSGRAQTSFGQPLPSIEQIALFSYGNIRNLNIVTAVGDSGAYGQIELLRNFALTEVSPQLAGWGLEPFATAAIGMVRSVNRPSPERPTVTGHKVSTGFKLLGPMQDNLRSSELLVEGAFIRSTDKDQRQRSLSATWIVRF